MSRPGRPPGGAPPVQRCGWCSDEVARGPSRGDLFDVDHFEQINDRFGHVAADCVLRELAELVQGRVRREGCFVRYGGDEFALRREAGGPQHDLVLEPIPDTPGGRGF